MKKLILIVLVVAMVFTLFACKPKKTEADENKGNDINGSEVENNNSEPDNPSQDKKVKIKLYFVNREYILTGSEDLDRVIGVEREIEVGERPVEEIILKELKDRPDGDKLTTIVDKIKILGVQTKGNTAYVDVSSENLNGGSMEEQLILQQIVLSLTELEGVDQVQFLIDGKNAETLMGHIFIDEPLKGSEEE